MKKLITLFMALMMLMSMFLRERAWLFWRALKQLLKRPIRTLR